ncbi:MAG: ABC transporter substrate-binding protein [Acetobacteraceae bacterium]
MSQKLVEAAPGATLEDKSKAFADHPVGSGPFYLTHWDRNNEMVLSRNPYYWAKGADGQALPYLDAIRFVIIPDDATRLLKLKAGEVDAAEFVPYSRVAELKADPTLNMVLFPAAQVNYFALNDRPALNDGTKNPLADPRVRQALNYATDKDALIQVVTYETACHHLLFLPADRQRRRLRGLIGRRGADGRFC